MYLSKYQIDIRSRAGRQLLSSNNRQPLHQVVLGKLFGEDAATHHILFRVTGQDLYVQSDIPPKYVVDGLKLIYTNERDSSIQNLKVGDVIRFNLMAMPVKSISQPRQEDGSKPRGKRIFLATPEERMDWLYQKGEKGGFLLLSGTEARKTSYGFRRPTEKGGSFRLPFTEFAGQMTITDPKSFYKTIQEGIGPERAFGCGLLFILSHNIVNIV